MKKIVFTSMYANPIHPGHIECLEMAKDLGDELWVIINNDFQAQLKRGVPSFQDEVFRMRVVQSIKPVDKTFLSIDNDPSVCSSIATLFKIAISQYPDCEVIFAKGGDRFASEIPERKICDELGIKIVDGLGAKIYNSSELLKKVY
jgi:D-beta-D-heptose 7-phosphate kinase/D-beta-D-heptose 1-phosphate adenosyltransferase